MDSNLNPDPGENPGNSKSMDYDTQTNRRPREESDSEENPDPKLARRHEAGRNLEEFQVDNTTPSVSVGNVGQLTIDLLISTLPTKKIGIVHHPAIHAMVGGDPYNPNSKEVTTSADLHLVEEHSIVILQIRAPLIKRERQKFLEELVAWCKNVGIKDVVMLSSCNAYERWDSQISGTQLRYYTSNVSESCVQMLRSVGAAELEERTDEFGKKQRFLSGAGFVQPFMDICELPVATLIKFVDEGDNRSDAYALATYLNAWKHLLKETNPSWKAPFSWKNLYGGPQPVGLC